MISKLLEIIESLSSGKNYNNCNTTPLQTTAAIIIPKSQVQEIHIWCHHSGAYYQKPLLQQ